MKINETGRINGINPYQRNAESSRQSEAKISQRKDEVSISSEAMEMLQASGKTESVERKERIQDLKNQVSTGTYQVESGKLAEKLMPYFSEYSES